MGQFFLKNVLFVISMNFVFYKQVCIWLHSCRISPILGLLYIFVLQNHRRGTSLYLCYATSKLLLVSYIIYSVFLLCPWNRDPIPLYRIYALQFITEGLDKIHHLPIFGHWPIFWEGYFQLLSGTREPS